MSITQSHPTFEAWQIGDDFMTWCKKGRPGFFGQWFLDYHKIEGHSNIRNEMSEKRAKELILREI